MEKSTWDYDHLPCSALLGMSRSLAKETFLKNFKKNKKVYQQQSTVFIINNQSASVGGEKKKGPNTPFNYFKTSQNENSSEFIRFTGSPITLISSSIWRDVLS